MKINILNILILTIFHSQVTHASSPVEFKTIYGDDNRRELYECSDFMWKDLSRSVVALVESDSVVRHKKGDLTTLKHDIYGKYFKLCTDQRYFDQMSASFCSGVLVGPDLVLTAGHCVTSEKQCKENKFVFDYAIIKQGAEPKTVPTKNIYECRELIFRIENELAGDWALIRLDRVASDRRPVRMRQTGQIRLNESVFMMGFPHGLPLKIVDQSKVTAQEDWSFITDLDSSTNNSGSPVFNMNTGELEGLLVEGEEDFDFDQEAQCNRQLICNESRKCEGEKIARIAPILSLIPSI